MNLKAIIYLGAYHATDSVDIAPYGFSCTTKQVHSVLEGSKVDTDAGNELVGSHMHGITQLLHSNCPVCIHG